MNEAIFQQAQAYYERGEFRHALGSFTQCLQDATASFAPGEVGGLYHRIGNCLVKLNEFEEAIHAYSQAAADANYTQIGAVNCNLGNCYAALHDFENAVKHFEIALSDASYDTPFKAYTGLGKAYLKLGKTAEAGSAFRSAAVDEANPNPAQALLNLGICFMALNRAADAVASYESALQFPMSDATRNKLYANLGQAYTRDGKMQQAVNAFEMALADKTYYLSDAASVDYQRAIGAVAQGTAVLEPVSAPAAPVNDMSGLDVLADATQALPPAEPYDESTQAAYYYDTYAANDAYQSSEDRFFNATDKELEAWSKGVARQDRKRRNVGLKIFVTFVIIALLVLGAAVFAFWRGYGWPTQEAVAAQVFSDKDHAASLFSSDVAQDKVATMLEPVVSDPSAKVEGVERSTNSSTAYVTATSPEGGEVHYKLSMVRSGIGWKLTGIELYFPSQSS